MLTAVLDNPDMADKVRDRLSALPRTDLGVIMDRIIDTACDVSRAGKWA